MNASKAAQPHRLLDRIFPFSEDSETRSLSRRGLAAASQLRQHCAIYRLRAYTVTVGLDSILYIQGGSK